MKGLLLKDVLAVRQQAVFFLLCIALWLFIGFMTPSIPYFPIATAMFIVIIPINMLGYDEKAKWDKYALSMPVSRAAVAMSKYVMTYLIAAVCFLLSVTAHFVMTGDIGQSLLVSGGSALVGIGIASLMLFLMYKFGSERGRFFFIGFALIPVGISVFIGQLGSFDMNEALFVPGLLIVLVAVLVLLIVIPPLLAVRLYQKKDFS